MKIVESNHRLNRHKRLVKDIKSRYIRSFVPCGFKCCSDNGFTAISPQQFKFFLEQKRQISETFFELFPTQTLSDYKNLKMIVKNLFLNEILPIIHNLINEKSIFDSKKISTDSANVDEKSCTQNEYNQLKTLLNIFIRGNCNENSLNIMKDSSFYKLLAFLNQNFAQIDIEFRNKVFDDIVILPTADVLKKYTALFASQKLRFLILSSSLSCGFKSNEILESNPVFYDHIFMPTFVSDLECKQFEDASQIDDCSNNFEQISEEENIEKYSNDFGNSTKRQADFLNENKFEQISEEENIEKYSNDFGNSTKRQADFSNENKFEKISNDFGNSTKRQADFSNENKFEQISEEENIEKYSNDFGNSTKKQAGLSRDNQKVDNSDKIEQLLQLLTNIFEKNQSVRNELTNLFNQKIPQFSQKLDVLTKLALFFQINDPSFYVPTMFSSPKEHLSFVKSGSYLINHTSHIFLIINTSNISLLPHLFSKQKLIEIRDLLYKSAKENTDFEEHCSEEEIRIKMQEGGVFKGTLYVNAHNCYSGIVHAKYKGRNIRIQVVGKKNMNRAFNLDTVFVELKEKECEDLIENECEYLKNKQNSIYNNQETDIGAKVDSCEKILQADAGAFKELPMQDCDKTVWSNQTKEKADSHNDRRENSKIGIVNRHFEYNSTFVSSNNTKFDSNTILDSKFSHHLDNFTSTKSKNSNLKDAYVDSNSKKEKNNTILCSKSDEIHGKIIGIAKRTRTPIIGTILRAYSNYAIITPMDRKLPRFRIQTSQSAELINKRLLCKFVKWESDSNYPFAVYIRRIGSTGDLESEIESVKVSYGIDYQNYVNDDFLDDIISNLRKKFQNDCFSENEMLNTPKKCVVDDLRSKNHMEHSILNNIQNQKSHNAFDPENCVSNQLSSSVEKEINSKHKRTKYFINDSEDTKPSIISLDPKKCKEDIILDLYPKIIQLEEKTRLDCRNIPIMSIDPEGCTDIDDAISFVDKGSVVEIGVHIADVTYFVNLDSKLDLEARNRGTTVYLTDRRYDMLPEILSSRLCSLQENEDRLAFSVFWVFDKERLKNCNIYDELFDFNYLKNQKEISEASDIHFEVTDKQAENYCVENKQAESHDVEENHGLIQNKTISADILKFSGNSPLLKVFFARTIIKSQRSFTYEQAQKEMSLNSKTGKIITLLNNFAKKLKNERKERGCLELNTNETKISFKKNHLKDLTIKTKNNSDLDIHSGQNTNSLNVSNKNVNDLSPQNDIKNHISALPIVENIERKVNYETNSLIEELMLLANITVAKATFTTNKRAILRRHPKFADDSFIELKEYLLSKNIDLDYISSKDLNKSLQNINDADLQQMIKKIVTRSMNQAVYFCADSHPFEEFEHYGLAFPIYTHFTSPIRRYADIMVHRQLESVLDSVKNEKSRSLNENKTSTLNENELNSQDLDEICRNINFRNRNSMLAALEIDKLFTYLYIKNIKKVKTTGFIIRIRKNGFVVHIQDYNIDETVIFDHNCKYDTENMKVLIKDKIYSLYDHIDVCIRSNDELFFLQRKFDIEII